MKREDKIQFGWTEVDKWVQELPRIRQQLQAIPDPRLSVMLGSVAFALQRVIGMAKEEQERAFRYQVTLDQVHEALAQAAAEPEGMPNGTMVWLMTRIEETRHIPTGKGK